MITVLGAEGFIGSHLVARLSQTGANLFAPQRNEPLEGRELGDVIYCIGLTADFRTRPFATAEAHVCRLCQVLRDNHFESLLYLSSTRVYKNSARLASESEPLAFDSSNADDLYDISKIMGESLTLSCEKNTRVARISNVYGKALGSLNFLATVLSGSVTKPNLVIATAADSEKDYISIDDVVETLIRIVQTGKQTVYNLASGVNTSNRELARKISELTGCTITFDPTAAKRILPAVNIDRVRSEFGFRPRNVLDDLPDLVAAYELHYGKERATRL